MNIFPNPWLIVPELNQGRENIRREPDAAGLPGVLPGPLWTAYDLRRASEAEYRIAYDRHGLYVTGTLTAADMEGLARIELVIGLPSMPGRHYTAVIPVKESRRLRGTKWDLAGTTQQVEVELAECELAADGATGKAEVRAALAFADLGLAGGPVLGEEWRFNLIHVPVINTGPLLSWAPVRACSYVENWLVPDSLAVLEANVVDQGRWGSLFFGGFPEGPALPADGWRLEYAGFTAKRLVVQLPEAARGMQAHDRELRLQWQEPRGTWQELHVLEQAEAGGWTCLAFSHPAPLKEGLYRIRLLEAAGESRGSAGFAGSHADDGAAGVRVALFTLDREALIGLGEAAYASAGSARETAVEVEPASASEEVQAVLELIPGQSGFKVCGLPGHPDWKPVQAMYQLSADGRRLIGTDSGEVYPNPRCPENRSVTVKSRSGKPLVYPYHEDEAGRRYFFTGRLWFEQRLWAVERTAAIAGTDPLGAARLLYRFAEAADGYVRVTNGEWNVYPNEAAAVPIERSGIWSPWHVVDLNRGLLELLEAYRCVKRTNALEVLSAEIGEDADKIIVEELFVASVDAVLQFPLKAGHNTEPYMWQGLIAAGIALGKPDYVHLALEWIGRFLDNQFLSDGFWKEVTLSYHSQVLNNAEQALQALQGYTDPPGYVSPRTGLRFDDLKLQEQFPNLRKARDVLDELAYPNGLTVPVQDTWANETRNAPSRAEPALLTASGVGRLATGQGPDAMQLYLMFTPKYGHNHLDPLNMTLFAEGQELLPDLGYTSAKYRWYSTSTLAHNTVVVNGRSMQVTEASRHGGRVERLAALDGLFQTMRVSQREAYEAVETYSREPWLVPFPGSGGNSGYVLDLFRVSGGERHEYVLQGDANVEAWFQTELELDEYGPYLLPPGVPVREPVNQIDSGNAGGHDPGYMYVRDVRRAALPGDRYEVTLLTEELPDGKPLSRLRITGLLEPGANELLLGRSPSIRMTRLMGKGMDNTESAEKYSLPKLVLRREGEGLRSAFVTVLEPYRSSGKPRLDCIERLPLEQAPPGAAAVRVVYGETTDILLSNPGGGGEPLTVEDMRLQGEMGFIRLTDGVVTEMALIGGVLLRIGERELTGQGPATGIVAAVRRKAAGDAENALVTREDVPEMAAGQYVRVTHPDGSASGYRIEAVRREAGVSGAPEAPGESGAAVVAVIVLAECDPGFQLSADGSSRQVFYPGKRWESGAHTFEIANVERASWA